VAERVLLVALSARALARSARAAGFAPIALDAFADLDLREVAEAWARVPVGADWRFRRTSLLDAARRLAPPPVPLVWGSGFERDLGTLGRLAAGRPLWGTPPARVRGIVDPLEFARRCRELGIPHPETRILPPPEREGWLAKRRGGAGGGHVRPARGVAAGRGVYFQRRVPGEAWSVTVVGDGGRARALAFCRQHHRAGGHRFAGVTVMREPPPRSERLAAEAEALAAACGLVGLGSVDLVLHGTRHWVLELNPRPTAALEPLEVATGTVLFAIHRAACDGILPAEPLSIRQVVSTRIVAAPFDLVLPGDFRWPAAARDRTPPGVSVPAGAPLCTLLVAGEDVRTARSELVRAHRALYRALAATARTTTMCGG